MQRIHGLVKVRGTMFIILGCGPSGEGKFFGRRAWLLMDEDWNLKQCYGKAVAHNSAIEPAMRDIWVRRGVQL